MRVALAAAALLAAACVPEEGPLMAPGQDCIQCHGLGDAKRWTAAGTWAKGAHVTLTDANGKSFTLEGNDVGNFYTAESLRFPLHVSVDGKPMEIPVKYGGCNLCHQGPGPGIEPSELMAPGRDCLQCHNGSIAPAYSAAGTFKPGDTIVVGGITRTGNAVGNFFIEEPLGFPRAVRASVNGSDMDPDPTYGGCNRCHGPGGEAFEDD